MSKTVHRVIAGVWRITWNSNTVNIKTTHDTGVSNNNKNKKKREKEYEMYGNSLWNMHIPTGRQINLQPAGYRSINPSLSVYIASWHYGLGW